jgi:hypothetical protein
MENDLKIPAQYWAGNPLRGPARGVGGLFRGARRPVPWVGGQARLGRGLTARSSRGRGTSARALARPQHGHRARDSAVAELPSARRWLAGGKIHPRTLVGLRGVTGQVGRRWHSPERRDGGEAEERTRGGGVRRR